MESVSAHGQKLETQFIRPLWSQRACFMIMRSEDVLEMVVLKVERVASISSQREKNNRHFLIHISGHHRYPSLLLYRLLLLWPSVLLFTIMGI